MIVAGLQLDIAWEDPRESFRRASGLAERAAREGARLLVLPEMFATGFSMRSAATSDHADATREFLGHLARRLSLFVLGGFAEPGAPLPFNACALYGPDGEEILHYRKIHPFTLAGEEGHYQGGDRVVTAEADGLRVTPLVCYDLRFPEPFRVAASDTDLFAVLANWPERRRDAWRLLLRARAVENQCFVLGVNRVGPGGGEDHAGDSALVDPFGRTRAEAAGEPAVVRGTAAPEEVRAARARFGFLRDRRPEAYRR